MDDRKDLGQLPPEILASVISQGFAEEADLVFLWTTLRNVNHRFRALVEEYVRKNYLRKTYITYRIRGDAPGVDDDSEMWLSWHGVDRDSPSTAVFAYDKEMSNVPGTALHRLEALQEKLHKHPVNDWLHPPHMLSVERYVNDTELCGFRLILSQDEGAFEVRFTWTDTFTRLLAEEKLRQTMSRRWVS